jgi:hypothetical protein
MSLPTTTVENVVLDVPGVGAGELEGIVRATQELAEPVPAAPERGVRLTDSVFEGDDRPSIGWLRLGSLRVLAGRLLADFEGVPATLARALSRRATAELKRSPRTGRTVLAAAAWDGVPQPATIDELVAMFSEEGRLAGRLADVLDLRVVVQHDGCRRRLARLLNVDAATELDSLPADILSDLPGTRADPGGMAAVLSVHPRCQLERILDCPGRRGGQRSCQPLADARNEDHRPD